ncbi:MAG: lysophospholipid acyltransferase family protein [Oscillospiraceae bacterium]
MAKDYNFDYNKKIKSKKGFSYKFWVPLAHFITFCKFKEIKMYGLENMPLDGGFILAPNHVSWFDPITIGANGKRDMHFMTKDEHFSHWYMRILLPFFNGFPVNRGGADKSALEYAIRVVKEGHILCIFPEGTRSKTYDRPKKGKSGVALIAREANADVMPVSIHREITDKNRPKIIVRFGEMIKHEELGFSETIVRSELKCATNLIMERIGELWDKDDVK